MKLKSLFVLGAALCLTSCTTNGTNNTSSGDTTPPQQATKKELDYEYQYSDKKTIYWYEQNEYTYEQFQYNYSNRIRTNGTMFGFDEASFTNKLPEPSTTIRSRSELASYLDHAAFYGRSNLTLTVDYSFADIDVEINKAYWEAKLLSGVIGMDYGYDLDKNEIYINLFYNPSSNCFRPAYQIYYNRYYCEPAIPYTYYPSGEGSPRDESNTVFPYQSVNTRGTIDVYNSEQLIYVLENGYIPNCLPDSPAEEIFNRCKYILNGIIDNTMSDMDKMVAIFSWLLSNNVYDANNEGLFVGYNDNEHFPDEVASCFECMFAEGSILGGYAVCQGYSKGFNLLATIEGINSTKVSASYGDVDNSKTISSIIDYRDPTGALVSLTYSSHGYSYVLDPVTNLYFLCDPTYTWNGIRALSDYYCYTMFAKHALMVPADYWQRTKYTSIDAEHDAFRKNHQSQMATEMVYDYRDNFLMKYNDVTFDTYIDTEEDVENFSNYYVPYCNSYNNPFFCSNQDFYSMPIAVSEDCYLALRNRYVGAYDFDYWYYDNMSFEEYAEVLEVNGIINFVQTIQ